MSGYWINYSSGQVEEIDDHEQWIRRPENRTKVGVPDALAKEFERFIPVRDRRDLLLFLMSKVPIMRVREHGFSSVTFEFHTPDFSMAIAAIRKFTGGRYGPQTWLVVANFATGDRMELTLQDFRTRYS